MSNPFAKLISLHVDEHREGYSKLGLDVAREHLNPHGVVHGAVVVAQANDNYAIFKPSKELSLAELLFYCNSG